MFDKHLINIMLVKGLRNNTDFEPNLHSSNPRMKFQNLMAILYSQSLLHKIRTEENFRVRLGR